MECLGTVLPVDRDLSTPLSGQKFIQEHRLSIPGFSAVGTQHGSSILKATNAREAREPFIQRGIKMFLSKFIFLQPTPRNTQARLMKLEVAEIALPKIKEERNQPNVISREKRCKR